MPGSGHLKYLVLLSVRPLLFLKVPGGILKFAVLKISLTTCHGLQKKPKKEWRTNTKNISSRERRKKEMPGTLLTFIKARVNAPHTPPQTPPPTTLTHRCRVLPKTTRRVNIVHLHTHTQTHTHRLWHRWACRQWQRVENFSHAKGLKVIWCIHCHLSFSR